MNEPARLIEPEVTLVAKALRPGGLDYHQAVAAAEANIQTLREPALARVDAILARLVATRQAAPCLSNAEIRRDADELAGLCGLFARPEIGMAAATLCRLLDAESGGAVGWAAVLVHLDALHLFNTLPPASLATSAPAILNGLAKVVESEGGAGRSLPG